MARPSFTASLVNYRVYIACLVIIILDVVAGVLGIQAEIAQNKARSLRVWIFRCQDPSYHALSLAMAAVVFLALAQVVTNLSTQFVFIRSKGELQRSSSNKQLAVVSLIFSWILFIVAFALLVSGAMANSRSRRNCGIYDRRFLLFGGILCFIHGLFSVSYCFYSTAAVQDERNLNTSEPQLPASV